MFVKVWKQNEINQSKTIDSFVQIRFKSETESGNIKKRGAAKEGARLSILYRVRGDLCSSRSMLVLFLGQTGKTLRRRIDVGIVFRSNWEDS